MSLDVRWVSAFIDVPPEGFDTALSFWTGVPQGVPDCARVTLTVDPDSVPAVPTTMFGCNAMTWATQSPERSEHDSPQTFSE